MQNKHIAIIGGGVAGLETAINLANNGFQVTIIEKKDRVGGKLNQWNHLFPDFGNPADVINDLSKTVFQKSNINIIYNTAISHINKIGDRFELTDDKSLKFYADGVVVASGFDLFDASMKEEYGYGIFDNVITSADYELLRRQGKPLLCANGQPPKRVGIIHCVGSRDLKVGNIYCSKVCCITGIKQAIEINDTMPDCEVLCFYMDLRLYGSKFDALYLNAQKHHKIQFIRGRLSEASECQDKSLQLKAEDTLSGRPLRTNVDMLILLVGIEPCTSHITYTETPDLQVDENGFMKSKNIHTSRNISTLEGVFLAGTSICPMPVNESIESGRSAASKVLEYFQNLKS